MAIEKYTQENEATQQKLLQYLASRDINLRNELAIEFGYIPKTIAAQMRNITANYAQIEDIVNNGYLTLIECLEKYDPSKGMKFESYAFMRVKGSNIDFVRKQDWLPRRVRKTAKDLCNAYDELANTLMREPTKTELAEHLGVEEQYIAKHFREMTNSVLLSFEMLLQSASDDDDEGSIQIQSGTRPETNLMRQELREQLIAAIGTLTEKERIVVSLSFYEGLKLAEIAQVMQVSEARVCQIRAKAVLKLRAYLESYMKG